MSRPCCVNCIVPPHILQRLLQSGDPAVREIALSTLLATTQMRAERRVMSSFGFTPSAAGTRRRTVFDCGNRRVLEQARIARSEGDPPVQDDAVNRAYDGLGQTYDFFRTAFDRNSIDNRGMRLDGYVHFGRSYNNAFWNGRQMVFGDGDGRLFADFTQSLDVIAHELAHGVTDFTAGLEYRNQSGALNESMSDVFGSLVKQWVRKETADRADWLIGADIFTPSVRGDALRSMKDPGRAYDDPLIGRDPQPGHMDDFQQLPDTEEGDWGGVHINSGIPNRAFYLAAIAIGGYAWEAAGQIWYESLKASTPTTEFQEFADRTHETAGRLFGVRSREQRAVRDGWAEVGIRVTAPAGRREMEHEPDAALAARIEEIASRVETLRGELAILKAAGAQVVN